MSVSPAQTRFEANVRERKTSGPPRRGKTLTCVVCGQPFYVPQSELRRGRKYCSQACMGQANIKLRACSICGKEFPGSRLKRKTCSPACASEAQRRSLATRFGPQMVEKAKRSRRLNRAILDSDLEGSKTTVCARPGCGAPLIGQAKMYCSPACHYADRKRLSMASWPIHACQRCGKEFRWNGCGKGTYCSLGCARKDGSKRRKAPRVIVSASRTQRSRRADFRDPSEICRACGKGSGVQHHHVIFRQHVERVGGDYWHPDDALALCVQCHLGAAHTFRLPLTVLRDENYRFARDLLGPERAYEYLRRRYIGDDPRLRALEKEYDHSVGVSQ